nr:MAG TPA: endosialidase chaperone [Crassvirales sp.]
MSKIPAINEIDANSPSQESTEVVVNATTITPDINEIQETVSASATIQEIDGTRKPTISEIYKIVNDGLFESTTNWWDYAYKLSQAQINQDIISRLDNGIIGGGYSKGVDIITTTSNKVPNNTNVYSALKSDSLYPKKLNDEVINGIYDFLNGLTIGKPTAYTGGTWSVDQVGRTHLTTDYLYVRLKAIFETLQILNVDTIGGKLVISPAGSIRVAYVDRIKIDAPVFKHDEKTDVWSISQVEDAEGNLVNETLNQEVYRCYFLGEQDGEEVENKWKVGDQAQAKTFNVKKGTYHKVENSYLWRLVVNVSTDTVDIDGKKYHYVDLSQIDFDSGSDAPAPGDVLNQLGHRLNDTQRQTALVLNAVDNYAPSITLYAGINYYTFLNKEYVEFGVYNGKAFFNVYGDMYIGDKGTNPKTYIKYKNGKINIKANLEIGSSIGDKDLDQYIKENGGVDEDTVKNLINNSQVIKDLQKQTDGAIETWFYEGVPTPNNYPSTDKENKGDVLTYNIPGIDWYNEDINNYNAIKDSDKYTEAEKKAIKIKVRERHIGDLYYDQKTGYAYRFTRYDDDIKPYRWNVISDSELTKILETANKAQATADGKMKVFYGVTKPTNYQVGDIWVNATLEGKFNNDIARAVAKSESFNADDWVLASRYSEAIATIQKWTNEYEIKFGNLADEVRQQKDQSIVVWYYDYEPTVDNIPANTWNTNDLRSEHIGDIFYDIKNNHSYRWTGTAWVQIKDADFDKAMKAAKDADDKAGAAGDLADSKRRIFYSATTPTKPFDKGDLWIKQVDDKTETWVYNGTNWVKSDDKDLAKFTETVNKELTGIKGQLDGKAETWYQVDDPSTDWTDKTSHKGDIWYNTNDGTTNYWNGSAWEQMDIPKDVFDTIDGKSSIFVDSYADAKAGIGVICNGYKERDLWILPEDATVNGVKYYKGDMLTAISNNTKFNEANWKKKVRYVGPTELNSAIDGVNEKINSITDTTIPGINNKFNEFIKDGVLDTSEKARLTDLLNQANNEVAAVIDQVNNITTSKYLTNDNDNKGKLEEANTVMKTAWTEYKNLINTLTNANTEITKVNIGEANTKYRNLQEKIKAVKQYLAICQADVLRGMGTDISSYKYLKDALNQTTEINGGLVLTSAIQLKDVNKKVTAGMNGIVKGNKTSIAAWYGGPMVDRDTFTSEELKTKVPGTDYAMSLLRHDGTGYLAGGNIHWDADGVLSGNFNSFILQGTSMVTMFYYIRLFYLHYANQNATDFNNIDYVTPMKTFSRLSVLPLGGTEGGNNLPTGLFIGDSKTGGSFQIGNIILRTKSGDPNILEIVSADSKKTAHLGVQGGVSAYGTYTPSTGGGGGLNGTIVPYATAIVSDPANEGSKIASASSIYKLHSRISSIENNGATSITVTGTGNAITSVSKNGTSITFTKGATFLTSHQSLANYYTKSSVDSLLSGKSATSHTHSVKINGITKTIAATGGTAVDLGTYLTSHQSLNGYATQSWVKSQGYLTSHQDVSILNMANDRYYSNNAYGINMRNSDIIGVNSVYTQDLSDSPTEAILFCRSNGNYDGIRAANGVLYFSNNVVKTISKYDAEYEVYHKGNLTKLSQLTNDKNFVTGSVSGQTITINGVSTTWQNTWRGITDSYSGTSTGTSLSQKGANSLYNALHNGYASSAGNSDTVDGYHASGLLTALSNSDKGISITVGGTTKSVSNISVNYASSAGNADTVDGEHASAFTRIVGRHVINTSGTAPYNYIHLFRIACSSGYSTIDCEIDFRTRNHSAKIEIRISTAEHPYNNGGSSISIIKKVVSGRTCDFWFLPTVQSSNYNYYDVYYKSGAWNSGSYGIISKGSNGTLVFEHKGTNLTSLPDKVTPVSNNIANSATKLAAARTIWGQSFDGTGNVNGTIYINNGDSENGAIILNNNVNANARISAIKDQVVFNTGAAIRFGAVNWEYSDWAGLKYDTVANAIYLGIADGTVFNCYSNKRSNGTLKFPGIKTITPDAAARIGGSGGDLYLGNANNSNWVKVQDICSQLDSNNWKINQLGNATFKRLTVNDVITCNSISVSKNAVIGGNLSVNGLINNKGILPTNYEVNNKGTNCYVSADALCSGITAITDSIPVDNLSIVYSNDNGNSWTNYNVSNDTKFKAYANVTGFDALSLGGNVITGNTDAEKLAQIKKNELMFLFDIPNSCYSQVYFACVDMGQGVGVTCTVEYLNSKGVIVNTYIKYMTGWNQFNYINLSDGNTALNVGNDDRRYIRFKFKHDQNTTELRNASINKIRIFAFTKYSFPTDRFMGHTGHIYNFDYNMNTYFPNSILAKGGVTAYQSSDIRLKTNITKLNCLNVIKSVGGTYEFDYIRDHKHSIGFIAQNVNNPLLNDIVAKDKDGYLKINYWSPKLISLAFGALTEIDVEVNKLKARVRELENEVEYLKNKDYALQ